MLKDKYEISLWSDELDSNGNFKQVKLCNIGSDTMTAQWRALESKLVENTNGSNTLTFKIYYRYIDNETGLETSNPIIKLLINERKIKAYWKNKWYHLVIKNIQENSSDWSFNITCKDQCIHELSKNGFNLEFSNELQNGSGTIGYLTNRVLDGTDWIFDNDNTPIIRQETEEPVFEYDANDIEALDPITNTPITITGSILVYYSNTTEEKDYTDFFYNPNGYTTYENSMLVKEGTYYTTKTKIDLSNVQISSKYRAQRIIDKQLTEYCPLIDRYVNCYTKDGKDKYGYQATIFKTPTTVFNLIANSSNIQNVDGWSSSDEKEIIELRTFPQPEDLDQNNPDNSSAITTPHSFINLKAVNFYKNWGLRANADNLPEGGLINGQKFILRYKYTDIPSLKPVYGETHCITSIDDNGIFSVDSNFTYYSDKNNPDETWVETEVTCNKNISINEILAEKYIDLNNPKQPILNIQTSKDIWLETIEFFEKFTYFEKDADGNPTQTEIILYPNDMYTDEVVQVVWRYFDKESIKGMQDPKDIVYELESLEPDPSYEPTNPSNFGEKVGTINIKESNRFNIIQKLAETFRCHAKFTYVTAEDDDSEGRTPGTIISKKISYYQDPNEDKGLTFVYGIDLKTIQRTIVSEDIVTKTIVPANGNAFGKNSFCTIARADANLPKTNYILNFDYYIQHGLLVESEVFNDLYNENTPYIGLFPKLNRNNLIYDKTSEKLAKIKNDKLHHETELKLNSLQLEEEKSAFNVLTTELYQLMGATTGSTPPTLEELNEFITANKNQTEVLQRHNDRVKRQANIIECEKKVNYHTECLKGVDDTIQTYQSIIDEQLAKNKEVEKEFFQKYSSFIYEGTWTSEDYVDDNLFYYDALSVSSTSARPKVQYNISVIRLSALEEFKSKVFLLGDVAYIQDNSFFGYDTNGNPIKEKVLVTEITSNFDNPEKDSFKIQNYKTQFEDLFQRITAQTQQLQYANTNYSRAASAITPQGTIKNDVLLKSLINNKNIVYASTNNAIKQDNTGITMVDQNNTSNQVKITSNGIIFTNDGKNWSTGISANGINASTVVTGSLDTSKITIFSANSPSFTWNEKGITAYGEEEITATYSLRATAAEQEVSKPTNFKNFVRFSKYGLFGIKAEDATTAESQTASEADIWENANFGMTWKGFFLKNKDSGGSIEITSDKDIRIYKGTDINNRIERVAIGRLGYGAYGIVIKDDQGNATFSTDTSGNLYITGVITAKKGGVIGGWNIGENELTFDKTTVYNNSEGQTVYYRELAGLCPLGKYSSGKYYTLYIGRSESGLQSDASNFSIDKCRFKVTEEGILYATGADIEGTITAGKGEIGGWTIDESQLYGTNTLNSTTYYTGMQSNGDVAFYAGTTNSSNLTNAKFYVKHDGTVTAKNIIITGTTSNPSKISTWSIDENSINNHAGTTYGKGTFMSTGTGGSYSIGGSNAIKNWVFGAGGNFGVTKDGTIYASRVYLNKTDDEDSEIVADGATFNNCTINDTCEILGVLKGNTISSITTEVKHNNTPFTVNGDILFNTTSTSSSYTVKTSCKVSGNTYGAYLTLDGGPLVGTITLQAMNGGITSQVNVSGFEISGGRVDVMGTLYLSNGSAVTSSDKNVKNTISIPTDAYSVLFDYLIPCTYKYNNGTSNRLHFGFIAQEVDDAMRIANVNRNDFAALCISNQGTENERWGLRYEEFVALNTWQIQKAKKRIESLEQQIIKLQDSIKNLTSN